MPVGQAEVVPYEMGGTICATSLQRNSRPHCIDSVTKALVGAMGFSIDVPVTDRSTASTGMRCFSSSQKSLSAGTEGDKGG